ncbi:hypothetical protein PV326_001904, partial [Microctonus aethiopoides]
MKRVDGQRTKTSRYTYEGFNYHEDTHQRGVRYTCASRREKDVYCKVVAIVKNNVVVIKNGKHKHGKPVIDIKQPVIRKLQSLANKSDHSPDEITDRVFV